MDWTIVAGRPVYLQLIEQLELAIITGEYPPGEKIPGVRDLAAQAQVNPNTMQRALAELEARGLLETQRTAGRTVTSDTEKLAQARQSLARKLVHDFYRQASALGLTKAELAALLEQLNDPDSALCARAERQFAAAAGGDCSAPVGCYARPNGGSITIYGFSGIGNTPRSAWISGRRTEASVLAEQLAEQLK